MIEDLLEHISNGWPQKTVGRWFTKEEVDELKSAIDKQKELGNSESWDMYFNNIKCHQID